VLSLGATKNGALAAEAVVVFDPALTAGFAQRRKRAGHLLSKMRFLSAQLVAMLEQGRWLRYAAHANAMADRLAGGLAGLPGLRLVQQVEANELFVAMPEPLIAALHGQGFAFHRWLAPPGVTEPVVRLVTSFATEPAEVDGLIAEATATQRPGSG
jgi:threonine aldolase